MLSLLGLAPSSNGSSNVGSVGSSRIGSTFAAYLLDFSEGAVWRTSPQLASLLATAACGDDHEGHTQKDADGNCAHLLHDHEQGGSISGGCVWDVGANNGLFYSNSFYLIAVSYDTLGLIDDFKLEKYVVRLY